MPVLVYPCKSSFDNPCLLFNSFFVSSTTQSRGHSGFPKCPLAKIPKSNSVPIPGFSRTLPFHKNWDSPTWDRTHVTFCLKNEVYDEIGTAPLPGKPIDEAKNDIIDHFEGLELLGKPSPKPIDGDGLTEVEEENKKTDEAEVLEPFYKFFRPTDSLEESNDSELGDGKSSVEDGSRKVNVEYYEPKLGDFVVGVVVSGNDNRLDVNVGADLLGTMLTKEVLPLYSKEMDYLLCDIEKDAEEFLVRGKMGIMRYDDAPSEELVPGRPVVEPGTVLFAEVLGRTLSGRPLLSTRRFFRRIAWHRVRQIKQLNEPIMVKITEWNTGGLLTRIEGLRAFLPKAELMNRINSFIELKENVGRCINVLITRINEDTNDLILSEKEAWEMLHLQDGTLLEGTVKKIFPYGAQIRIGETNRCGLLHISNITRGRIASVSELLAVDEKVKVLVVKSVFPGTISLSIADLESEPGLFASNKEIVFSEAEETAKKYRQKLPAVSLTRKLESIPTDILPYKECLYANWKWFKFERDNEPR